MRLDALLRAHAFMKVERPPELWAADTDDIRFLPLLGEMIAAPLSYGVELDELTLSVANVVVEPDPDHTSEPLPGEYVAVTVRGQVDLGPDATWHPGTALQSGLLGRLRERLVVAGALYAYVRRMPPEGSITVFLARLAPEDPV